MSTSAEAIDKVETGVEKPGIFPILLINFIGVLGYSIVIPILIFIVEEMGGNGFIYGLLGATYPLFQFIGAPILGKLSDRIGRRKVLIISQVGTLIAWVMFFIAMLLPKSGLWSQDNEITGAYVMTLPLLMVFIARILDGFTGGNVSVANAYLSDVSTDKDRSRNFGKMAVSASLGLVIGPAVAGVLAATAMGFFLPIMSAGLISLIAVFVISVKLKDIKANRVESSGTGLTKMVRKFYQVEHKECSLPEKEKKEKINWASVFKISGIPVLFAMYFFVYLAFSLFYACLPVYANTTLGWEPGDLGIFLTVSSLVMVVVQGPLLSRLSKRFSNQQLIGAGALLLAVSFFILSDQHIVSIYTANVLLSIGNGLMWPSFLGVLAVKGNKTNQGAIQGYGTSMGSIASMFGLVAGGILFIHLQTSVFLIGGIIFVAMLLLTFHSAFKTPNVKEG